MTTKKILTLATLLTLWMGAWAQSIDGIWKADQKTLEKLEIEQEENMQMDFIFFFKGNEMELRFDVSVTEPELGKLDFRCSLPGTYTRSGNQLKNMELNKDKLQFTMLPSTQFNDEITKEHFTDENSKRLFIALINATIEKEMAGSMKESMSSMADAFREATIDIKQITDTRLVLGNEEMELSFDKKVLK